MATCSDNIKPVRCGCGGEAKAELIPFEVWDDRLNASASQYIVRCQRCYMTTKLCDSESEAIMVWNKAMGADQFRDLTKKTERTARAKYSNMDGEYLCKACGRVVQIEDAYCCGCGAKLIWVDEDDIPNKYIESGGR